MPGSNKYSTYQGNFGTEPDILSKELLTSTIENNDLRNIKNFKKAFRIARLRGLDTFKWGTSEYTTELKKTPVVEVGAPKPIGVVRQPVVEVGAPKPIGVVRQPVVEVGAPKPIGVVRTRYVQQGGTLSLLDQEMELAFLQFLVQRLGIQSEQELQAAILQLGEEGLAKLQQEFMQLIQSAKFGAKLNYIKSLRGVCPEGYDLQYYKQGGHLCKQCIKKQTNVTNKERNIPTNPIDAFKCGNRMKKKKK